MPNPKTGTVTTDVGKTVAEFKAGKVEYRTDRYGNVHVPIGKVSFDRDALVANYRAVLDEMHAGQARGRQGPLHQGDHARRRRWVPASASTPRWSRPRAPPPRSRGEGRGLHRPRLQRGGGVHRAEAPPSRPAREVQPRRRRIDPARRERPRRPRTQGAEGPAPGGPGTWIGRAGSIRRSVPVHVRPPGPPGKEDAVPEQLAAAGITAPEARMSFGQCVFHFPATPPQPTSCVSRSMPCARSAPSPPTAVGVGHDHRGRHDGSGRLVVICRHEHNAPQTSGRAAVMGRHHLGPPDEATPFSNDDGTSSQVWASRFSLSRTSRKETCRSREGRSRRGDPLQARRRRCRRAHRVPRPQRARARRAPRRTPAGQRRVQGVQEPPRPPGGRRGGARDLLPLLEGPVAIAFVRRRRRAGGQGAARLRPDQSRSSSSRAACSGPG